MSLLQTASGYLTLRGMSQSDQIKSTLSSASVLCLFSPSNHCLSPHHWATQRRPSAFSRTHFNGRFRVTNSPDVHVFGMWDEAGEPQENPTQDATRTWRLHTERSQVQGLTRRPSCYNATVQTIAMCHPQYFIRPIKEWWKVLSVWGGLL